ncbi:unnamed protein product [Ranitomeya imitator]|uniref:Gypsy retrotransposon integrase-like protein 1 n=1 Tax=Ranitomeya imitator TaxID=111125 RepID=A0ABN9KXJ0_9NEOB|nr:unnamed protein product [Ranitomeya imitator]
MTDKALAWANPLIESQDACLNDFNMFITAMGQMFDDPNHGFTVETALLNLRQDARISERKLERWTEMNRSNKSLLPFLPKEIPDSSPQESAPEPMQVNSLRSRVNDERKEFRFKENLCFYCGKSGHFIINCPSRSRRTTAAVVERDFSESYSVTSESGPPEIAATVPDYDFSDMNSVTSETIWIDSRWVNSSAMIDSGASGNFMDTSFAKKSGIRSQRRVSSILMETVDGSPLTSGPVDQQTESLKTLKEYIDENLSKGFIRPSSSPAGAPIFFVKKKDESLRPCVDYRDINKVTIKNRYPLPLIPELLERVRQAKVFSKLDLRGAYNLVHIRPGDEWKTAFRSRYGHFEYLVMPFGLCNAPATFQHLLYGGTSATCQYYLAAFEGTPSVHQAGEGLSMDNSKIKAIQEWPIPKNVKEVERFIGFANFYRRSIKNFSDIVSPITRLTQKKTAFIWSPQAQEAFSRLKTKFMSAPVLIHPDPELAFIIEVDASNCAVGAILSQRTGEKNLLHPCAFLSKRLSPAEKNYDVGNKELLAIIAAFKEWRHLLQGASQPIVVLMDHRNLEFISHLDEVSLLFRNGVWTRERRLYIPEAVRLRVLKMVHDSKVTGHRGIQKTKEFLSHFFWWPSFWKNVQKTAPFRGKEYNLVVVDRLTKAAHFIPCSGLPSAKDTADLIIQNIFRLHRVSDEVVSDRGVQFTSKFWRNFCSALGIEVNLSSAIHPQSNGQTERTNQTLEQYLRCYVCHLQDDWVRLLPLAEFSNNNSQSASTKQSPFYANLGYHPSILPRLPVDTSLPAVADRISSLQQNLELLKETLGSAQDRYKNAADRFRKPTPKFKVFKIINSKNGCSWADRSPLHDAAFHGRLLTVKTLIAQGFNVNILTIDRITPLHEACLGGHVSCAKVLLENRARINIVTVDGITPLYNACSSGSVACVSMLLDHGANPELETQLAFPLHEAVVRGHRECAEMLIAYGADIEKELQNKGTPLYLACANVNHGKQRDSPLHAAARRTSEGIVKLLIDYGANVKYKNMEGKYPIELSVPRSAVERALLVAEGYISVIKMHFGTNLPAGRFGGRTAHAPAILEDGGAQGEDGRTDGHREAGLSLIVEVYL